MTEPEDLIRSTTRSIAATVRDVPPLRLPVESDDLLPFAPSTVTRRPRRRRGWLAPVAAAAAVLAVAVSLVIVRDLPGGPAAPAARPSPAPAPSASAVPTYYVALTPANGLVVRDTFTGKTVTAIAPPPGQVFMGVSGTADDRTFLVDVASNPPSSAGENLLADRTAARSWELLRISPGRSPGYRLTALPIPATEAGTDVRGFTPSPNGSELAVVLQPGAADNSQAPVLLRLYSIATGAALRAWSTTDSDGVFDGGASAGPDAGHLVGWVSGTRFLAFGASQAAESSGSAPVKESASIMLLDTALPGGDLLADSRAAVALSPGQPRSTALGCGIATLDDVLVSGNGSFLACGWTETAVAPAPRQGDCTTGTARNLVAFRDYTLTRAVPAMVTIAGFQTRCYGPVVSIHPVWVSDSGSTVIGYLNLGQSDPLANNLSAGGQFGLFRDGTFTPLPAPPAIATEAATGFAW